MRILDRYIIAEFLKVFAVCLMGFVLVSLLVEIPDKIKLYFRFNPPGGLMLKYFLVKIPGYLFFAVPLAILLGGMLSLLIMARHYEIIAMQAGGVDAIAIAGPVMVLGLAASVAMFVANETVIPWSNRYSEYIQDVEISRKPDRTFFKGDQIWLRTPDSITHISRFDKLDNTLEGVTVIRFDKDYRFEQRIYADKAKWWGNHWVLYGVNLTRKMPDGSFSVQAVPSMQGLLANRPEDFGRVERLAKEMNLTQLGVYIAKMIEEGYQPTRYLVDWHDKIAFPLVCLIMAALSVPFAIRVGPGSGGMALGLAFSIVLAFCYWVVHTVFIALGHGGYVPPIAAAWAANVLFGLFAVILLLHEGT